MKMTINLPLLFVLGIACLIIGFTTAKLEGNYSKTQTLREKTLINSDAVPNLKSGAVAMTSLSESLRKNISLGKQDFESYKSFIQILDNVEIGFEEEMLGQLRDLCEEGRLSNVEVDIVCSWVGSRNSAAALKWLSSLHKNVVLNYTIADKLFTAMVAKNLDSLPLITNSDYFKENNNISSLYTGLLQSAPSQAEDMMRVTINNDANERRYVKVGEMVRSNASNILRTKGIAGLTAAIISQEPSLYEKNGKTVDVRSSAPKEHFINAYFDARAKINSPSVHEILSTLGSTKWYGVDHIATSTST